MQTQPQQIDLVSKSPINTLKLTKQNKSIAGHLVRIGKINRYIALQLYGVGDLHSRIPEIQDYIKTFGDFKIERQRIKVANLRGESTSVNEYWFTEETIKDLSFLEL